MVFRKLLLFALFTLISLAGVKAQDDITVHGTVADEAGVPQEGITVIVSVIFVDSSGAYETLLTDVNGLYEIGLDSPGPNMFGWLTVSMVDCQGVTISQQFSVGNGVTDVQADFIYCEDINVDSCAVVILQEWAPGTNYVILTAWTPAGFDLAYEWSTGETTPSITPITSGTYCVTVSNPLGCEASDCVTIDLDSLGNCFVYIVTSDNNDGSYNLEAIASGNGPFEYLWNTGVSASYINNVGPGTYCVTISDGLGCTYSSCIFIEDWDFCEVYIYEDPVTNSLFAYGYGQEPIVYVWSTGDTSQYIIPNEPGYYCVTATDANGCEAYSCYDYGSWQDTCFVYVYAFMQDSNTFALQAVGYSPTGNVEYVWSTGETGEVIYPQDPNQQYCVTMTDSGGCVATGCFDSNQWCYAWVEVNYLDTTTAVLTAYTDPIFNWPGNNTSTYLWSNGETTPTITVTESGEYCVTVSTGWGCETETCTYIDFESLGNECSVWVFQYADSSGQWVAEAWTWGWGTFEYLWSNGDTTPITVLNSPNEFQCVTVTSTFGCEATACVDTFYQPCKPWISIEYVDNQAAVLSAIAWNDPNQGATYLWNTGETGPIITVTQEGTYCVTVTSAGCVGEACVDVYFQNVDSCGVWISSSPAPSGVYYTANAWGVAPFSYLWSNGSTEETVHIDFGVHELCVTVTDAIGCVASGCNYPVDSCYIELFYTTQPTPSIYAITADPFALVYWSTGDTSQWIEISEPGTYCATVTTIFGCVATACITIDTIIPGINSHDIGGFVYADTSGTFQGWVVAYAMDPVTGTSFTAVDSSLINDDGFYYIDGLGDGVYLLKAVLDPNSPQASLYLPTYHLSAATWDKADPHVLPNWLPITTDIKLIRTQGSNGGGVIAGTVTDPQNIIAGSGDESREGTGLPNVEILLSDLYGQPLNFQWSLEDGSFRFVNLPWGTYRISFDIPGIYSPDIWVTLTPEDPERLQVTLIVEGAVAVEEPVSEEIQLYPNPAQDELHVQLPVSTEAYEVRIVDIQGKLVSTGSARSQNGVIQIGIEAITPGWYIIQFQGQQGFYYGRFIKQE